MVIGIDGKPVTEPGQLSRTIATMPPGTHAQLRVIRDGKERTLDVKVGKQPAEASAAAPDELGGTSPTRTTADATRPRASASSSRR